jgi:hypothetical protein
MLRTTVFLLALPLLALPTVSQLDGPPRTNPCKGRIVDDTGHPVDGATVEVVPTRDRNIGRIAVTTKASGRTDADGGFSLELLQGCVYDLSVRHPDHYEFPWRDSAALQVGGGTRELWIVVRRVRPTVFAATDQSGAPVGGFQLEIADLPWMPLRGGRSYGAGHRVGEERRLGDGSISADAEPGLHAYRASAPGFAPRVGLVRFDGNGERRQTIRLQPESRIEGRIVRCGAPVGGARLCLVDQGAAEGFPEREEEWSNDLWSSFSGASRATSDDHGEFSFVGLPPGSFVLEVAEGAGFVTRSIELVAGARHSLGDVELTAAAQEEGR